MIPPSVTLKGIWAALIALAFALVVAFAVVQTVRLEGFKIWPIKVTGALERAEKAKALADACISAGEANTAAQKAQKAAYEAKYKELAHEADEQVERAQVDAAAAAERYIAANRVRRNEGGVSTAAAAAGDSGAGSGDSGGRAPELVAVTPDDIRVCTTNTIRLEAAREWALSLSEIRTDP